MNSRFLSSVAALTLCSVCFQPPASAQSNFSSFDFPGAINTQATGIKPSGDMVEGYTNPDGLMQGYLLSNGQFRAIDVPRATSTDVDWINPRGQIVGNYFDVSGHQHGFLPSNGTYKTIDGPNAHGTAAFGIGAAGDITGWRCLIAPLIGSQLAEFSLAVNVRAGDTLGFRAGPGPDRNNDSDPTGFNVAITPESR